MLGLSPKAAFWINAIFGTLNVFSFFSALMSFQILSMLVSGLFAGVCFYLIKQQYTYRLYPYVEIKQLKKKIGL